MSDTICLMENGYFRAFHNSNRRRKVSDIRDRLFYKVDRDRADNKNQSKPGQEVYLAEHHDEIRNPHSYCLRPWRLI